MIDFTLRERVIIDRNIVERTIEKFRRGVVGHTDPQPPQLTVDVMQQTCEFENADLAGSFTHAVQSV